jgi:hypothetical protein
MRGIVVCSAAAALVAVGIEAERAELVDQEMAKDAVAVLRVRKYTSIPLPKYPLTRYDVNVTQVLKNESSENLHHDFAVHAFKDKPGVPSGECTVYIARYDAAKARFDKTNGTIWMLVGGDATKGVSHVDSDSKN